MWPRPLRRALALVLGLLVSCGGGEPERSWIHLAAGFEPVAAPATPTSWAVPAKRPLTWRAEPREAGAWVATTLDRDAWEPSGLAGVWRARSPVPSLGHPRDGGPACTLVADGEAMTYAGAPTVVELRRPESVPPGSFTTLARDVFLAAVEPPTTAEIAVYVERGAMHDGRWRVPLGRYTADGIPVWPAHQETVRVDLPPRSALHFATAGLDVGAGDLRTTFRVALDGETIFESERSLGPASSEWHRVVLPDEARAGARLTFSVEGPVALTAFLSPRIGPAEVGDYVDRPFDRRPDVILFLADTFRADLLATYGGEPGITPNIDAFAEEAVVFERAWSPSSWTLPSQASMMTALHPHQHSATDRDSRLPAELVTLAERMRDAGYRTGAVTDAAFVSRTYGIDQGFEWFDESWTDLVGPDGTLERVREFLDADDGRPVFLFIQTYRAHTPYVVSEETRRSHGDRLPFGDEPYEEFALRTNIEFESWTAGDPVPPGLRAAGEVYHAMYTGAAIDLDRGFARFRADLAARGLDRSGFLVFTSDHGEAFFEHDHLGHGTGVWEEFVRIPLLIGGPDLPARRISAAATLVDLPRTIAGLAGVPSAEAWLGRSLIGLEEDRPVFTFECRMIAGPPSEIALIEGERKVIALSSPDALRAADLRDAFDLARDPGEREGASDAPWAAEILSRLAPSAVELYTPVIDAERARLDADQASELNRLGY